MLKKLFAVCAAALLLGDVVVHASTDAEAFGRTVIEAQAMARPVIAADLGGPRETVQEGVTGWRVPPGDPAALAAASSEHPPPIECPITCADSHFIASIMASVSSAICGTVIFAPAG